MPDLLFQFVALVLLILGLVMLANRLGLAYPIVLVLGGLGLSFTRWFANISIDPNVIFFVFLPPLLYEAAWQTSWKELWRLRRVVSSFSFPIVILTAGVVALVSHALIPGFTLALGFLLGGIVSPPDAIAATAIMRRVQVPRTLLSLVEGESLLNDASSLIVFRFAVLAVLTGQFHWQEAAINSALVISMGVLIGLVVGGVFYAMHRWLPTTPSIESVLMLVTPYCMYFAAEHFHYSGVLAVVSGGLLLSNRRDTLLSPQSRVQSVNIWAVLGFVLNGLVFMLIGLELPVIVRELGTVSLGTAIGYGLVISGVLIVTRLLCTIGASAFTRVASRFITVADANPGWRGPLIAGWAGMRGVVSLAAALSIPLLGQNDQPFPFRPLILFITFIVILVTLVLQGLTLPAFIRWLHPENRHSTLLPEAEQELIVQQKLARHALRFVEQHRGLAETANEYGQNLRQRLQLDLAGATRELACHDQHQQQVHQAYLEAYLEVLNEQRRLLNELNHKAEFDEELLRRYLDLTDLEEVKVLEKLRHRAE